MSAFQDQVARAASSSRSARLALGTAVLFTLGAVPGCGGGGGGGSSGGSGFDSLAQLVSVTFPDPADVNPEPPESPPKAAPLMQRIVFTFSGRPVPDQVTTTTLPIRDDNGFPVPGSFVVDGVVATFVPELPTGAITQIADGTYDTGGTGLKPGTKYTVRVGPTTFSFIRNVAPALLQQFPDPVVPSGVLIGFTTTSDPALFVAGLEPVAPRLVAADPVDGTTGVSPNLYSDPDGAFPPRTAFFLTFDAAVNPALTNTSGDTFALIDLDDRPSGFPGGLPLGINVTILENALDRCLLQVAANGILPFGHLLALEYPSDLKGLSESGSPSGARNLAASFTTAAAPAGSLRDVMVEDFADDVRREKDTSQIASGALPADWNVNGSGILQAGFAFQGSGVLGRFVPPAPPVGETKVVVLDTSSQVFPLFDGSTPEAPPGFVVEGGIFSFTDIDIPAGVVILPRGNSPLVLTATGTVRIAGEFEQRGEDGTPDNAYDSAVTSVPGGAAITGGGRGGEGQPILFFPPDQVSFRNIVSPPAGGTGFGLDPADGAMKRIGGTGGQCGMIDNANGSGKYGTDEELDCSEFRGVSPGHKAPGGGGGSMYTKGTAPLNSKNGDDLDGRGNVIVDGQGHYTVRAFNPADKNDPNIKLLCGQGGQHPFFDDGDSLNDFFGAKGQLHALIGGQGGGAGGSGVEAYYCGIWCDRDSDSTNDKVCSGADFGSSGATGDSVGDARGGGGGGGGGALMIQALGSITLESSAAIQMSGGRGGGGEAIGCSNFAGSGAGGAGGMVILQSGTGITIQSGAVIDARNGLGDLASVGQVYGDCGEGSDNGTAGDGGNAGIGMIQLQVPAGQMATVVSPSTSILPNTAWVDPQNTINPVEFTSLSVAVSTWFDLGRVIARAPSGTNPVFSFGGLDALGYVQTDASGFVLDPAATDVVCDYLGQIDPITRQYKAGQEPHEDFIPPNARIKVEFQGADALVEGSKEVDPGTLTTWSASPAAADGRQFIRWRVTFNLTATPADELTPDSPRPAVQELKIHADF